ncbi:MAG: doubled protein [Bacillales bacterium]|jgi:predicted CXXCH cytochrome family protein|nr:doubled protein [Bacillales bacterium]
MKNFKIGFSLLVAILVLSIGTIAMAAKPAATAGVGIKAVDADTVQVSPGAQGPSYSKGQVTPAETGWEITLFNASDDTVAGAMQDVTTNYAQFDGVVEGQDYYVTVVAKTGADKASTFTSTDFTFEFSEDYNANNILYLGATEIKDNDIPNANGTGQGQLAKGISGHKTHGDYRNNTNSCASCHQTHTAAGKNLLFKETAEEACIACHDGTGMTIYNVFPTSMAQDNGSGTFAGTVAGNMSVHLTNETVELSAAPGSNMSISGANWSGEFSCDTCHNPHGSYSSRLLGTNTAGFMNVPRTYNYDGTSLKQWYGGLFANVPVVDASAQTFTVNATDKSILDSNGNLGTPALAVDQELKLMKYTVTAADVAVGGYYAGTKLVEGDIIWQFVKYLEGSSNPTKWQRIPFNTVKNGTGDFTVSPAATFTSLNNVKGYFKTATEIETVSNFRALQIVKLPQVPTAAAPVNGVQETKTPWYSTNLVSSQATVPYAQYCGTCHVDYASASGYATTGDNGEKAYHHTANSTSSGRSCAYCHYAHGTDITFMRDATGNTLESLMLSGDNSLANPVPMNLTDATAHLKDINPSSALKRYTNMSVCYGCHISSHYAGLGNNGSTGVGSPTGLGNNGLPGGIWQ